MKFYWFWEIYASLLDLDAKVIWGTFPFWLLIIVQWILAFGVTVPVMIILSLLWPIASLYYYDVAKTLGTDVQILLALMGTVLAVCVYPVVLILTLIGGLLMWICWIVSDIKAIRRNEERPSLLPEKYQGLYGFVH